MLHIIMPNQVSGPNNASKLIADSFLNEKYEFQFLTQRKHAGGKVNISLIRDLITQIKHFNPDLIHLSGLQSSGFHALIAAKLCRKKVLLAVRGSSGDAIGISRTLRFVFRKIIEPLTLRLSDKVYTVCKAMEQRPFIQNNTKGRLIGTIHNSAPIIDTDIQSFRLRQKLNINDDAIIVAVVGRIIYDKGVTFVEKAIRNNTSNNIKFVFLGEEPTNMGFEESLVNEIKSGKVFFLGKQEKRNVLSILKDSDIFLFATLHENLSNALLEAAAMGLAIVATDVGGNPEVITHNKSGIIIPSKSSDSILKAVQLLANNESLRKKLGENAIKKVNRDFSQIKLLNKISTQYSILLDK